MADDHYSTLIPNTFVTSSGSTLGTVGAGKSWIARRITIVSSTSSTGAITCALYCSTGGTMTGQYSILPVGFTVPQSGMAEIDLCDAMAAGETLAAVAGTGSRLAFRMSGDEYSS